MFFREDSGNECNAIVSEICLLTTTFTKADGQYVQIGNDSLAKKDLRNAQRSGPTRHVFELFVPSRWTFVAAELGVHLEKHFEDHKSIGSARVLVDEVRVGAYKSKLLVIATQKSNFQDELERVLVRDQVAACAEAFLTERGVEYNHVQLADL